MKVSAIIPSFNAAPYILRAVKSCLQVSNIIEVIVVNDGSTDSTIELLGSIHDSRLIIINHPDGLNHGRSVSRNLGINKASGDWIIFCDADDFCLPNRLSHLIDRDHSAIDGYYDLIEARTDDPQQKSNDILGHRGIDESVLAKELFNHLVSNRESWFNLTGLTVKKSTLQKIGLFDQSLAIAEDTDLIWRLSSNAHLVSGESTIPIAVRWVHSGNSYQDKKSVVSGRYAFYKKWQSLIPSISISSKSANRINTSYRYYQRVNLWNKVLAWFTAK